MTKSVGALPVVVVGLALVVGWVTREVIASVPPPPQAVATVYTANENSNTVSALDGNTLAQAHADIAAAQSPQSVSVSSDNSRVYCANGAGSITVIDGNTNEAIQTVVISADDPVTDLVISPDGQRVFAVLRNANSVKVMETASFAITDTYALSSTGSNTPNPSAIDVSPDGGSLFVLQPDQSRVVKIATADGSELHSTFVTPGAKELKVSADGATVIVVGSNQPSFLSANTLDPVVGAANTDFGDQVDVATAGTRAYVLNVCFAGPAAKAPSADEPSIDVFEMATGTYVESFGLGFGPTFLGITVMPDASRAFVSRADFSVQGSVTSVSLAGGAIGPIGQTGGNPRRVAVKDDGIQVPLVSYFLPKSVVVRILGPGKDFLFASGFYDDGAPSTPVDYSQPIRIDVGGFFRTITLVPKGATFVSPADPQVKLQLLPNVKGSSRGKFKLTIKKADLAGQVDPAGQVNLHFRAAGIADAIGAVTLTNGRYKLGKVRGALQSPPFFPARAVAKVGGPNADSFLFRGGFASGGVTPSTLGTVRFRFGPVFSRTIAGSQFRLKSPGVYTFSQKIGSSSFAITIDFLREKVTAVGKKVELGTLDPAVTDVLFDAGNGAGGVRNTIRVATKGNSRSY